MAVLNEIPILPYSLSGQPSLTVDIPESVMPGNWDRAAITITNNYLDETYPLTNNDKIFELHLTLKKGNTDIRGVFAPFFGGQFIHGISGQPIPRMVWLGRPAEANGSIKIYGKVVMYTDLEIGASVEYF